MEGTKIDQKIEKIEFGALRNPKKLTGIFRLAGGWLWSTEIEAKWLPKEAPGERLSYLAQKKLSEPDPPTRV